MQTVSSKLPPELRLFFDFTKAVAILGVFSLHYYDIYLGYGISVDRILRTGVLRYLSQDANSPAGLACFIFRTAAAFGGIGVPLFIIASGFGVYYSFLSRDLSWRQFFLKRFVRVVPLFYSAVLVSVLIDLLVYRNPFYLTPEGAAAIGMNLLFLHVFSMKYSIASVFVFVGIIVQLYLLFPLFVKLFQHRRASWLFFAGACVVPVVSAELLQSAGSTFDGALVFDYFPYFLCGMFLADSVYHGRNLHRIVLGRTVSLMAAAGVLVMVYMTSYYIDFAPASRMLMSFLVFFSLPVLFETVTRLKLGGITGYISAGAYAAYLFHMHIIRLAQEYFLSRGPAVNAVVLGSLYAGLLVLTLTLSYGIQKNYDRLVRKVRA